MIASVKVRKAAKQAGISNAYGAAVNPQYDLGHYQAFHCQKAERAAGFHNVSCEKYW
jgi:hypothetical protein